MKIIFLMMIGLSILNADFIKSGDIVSDNITNLEWQDDATPPAMNWQDAIDYCESLSLGGDSDWRLPNIKELDSLVDYTKYNPAINTSVFTNTTSSGYGSSTTQAKYIGVQWIVNFYDGSHTDGGKGNNYYVRCVRDGQ